MARIRTIKPDFFKSEDISDLPIITRLLFIGLWTQADREGRMLDRPKRLKAEIFPYDDLSIDECLTQLEALNLILRYEVNGISLIQITKFLKHQMPHYRELPSELPAPPNHIDSPVVAKPLTEKERRFIFERDGKVCAECGSKGKLSIDHIIPVSKGGTNDPRNLRVLCRSCNSSKSNRVNVGSTSGQRRVNVDLSTESGREGKGREMEGNGVEEGNQEESPPLQKFGEQIFMNISDLKEGCLNDRVYFVEHVSRQLKITPESIPKWLEDFNDHLKATSVFMKTVKDYRGHFQNWARIKLTKGPQGATTHSQPILKKADASKYK